MLIVIIIRCAIKQRPVPPIVYPVNSSNNGVCEMGCKQRQAIFTQYIIVAGKVLVKFAYNVGGFKGFVGDGNKFCGMLRYN